MNSIFFGFQARNKQRALLESLARCTGRSIACEGRFFTNCPQLLLSPRCFSEFASSRKENRKPSSKNVTIVKEGVANTVVRGTNYLEHKLLAEAEMKTVTQTMKQVKSDAAWKSLKKKKKLTVLTGDEQVDLESFEDMVVDLKSQLAHLKKREQYWADLIRIQAKSGAELESRPFKDADAEWIRRVTGVNTERRLWKPVLNSSVRPSIDFEKQFEETAGTPGRRFFLNLFLLDILKQPEFKRRLKIFSEIPLEVTRLTEDGMKLKLGGIVDYTIGLNPKGLDMFDIAPPKEFHFVAVEANVAWGSDAFWQCVAEAATLFKVRKDAGKIECRVWGVASNAKSWQFIHIDNSGLMWRSKELSLDLQEYQQDDVSIVYSFLFFVIKSCFECVSIGESRS
ncbi:hypothetical protein BDR26DRAFT_872147 [Obelidium mucronatum]|nr:hypothetical protein BDR26DRAFT_872147 [Obelidium mucronatum]